MGPRAGRTRAKAGARRREEGAWPRRLRPGDPVGTVGSLLPGAGEPAMLLSGGDPPAQEWFMVQTKSKPRVQRQRLQVQRIFRVKLNAFQSRPDTPYFWLQLEGPRENMGRAKVNSFSPPIASSQTLLSLLAPPPPQGSPEVPRPGFGSMASRYWAILLPFQICSLGSFSLVPSFFSAPPLSCVSLLSLKCAERGSASCDPPVSLPWPGPRTYSLLLHLGSNLRSCISVVCATYLFVLHQEPGRPRSFCRLLSLLKSWAASWSLSECWDWKGH